MRKLLAIGGACGLLIATSAFATDWQEVWNGDRKSGGTWAVSIDKESLKRTASKVRVGIMEKFSEAQKYNGRGRVPDFDFDMTIYDWVINCNDYTSVVMGRAYYLNSTAIRAFDERAEIPAPPQFDTGVPAALRAACS